MPINPVQFAHGVCAEFLRNLYSAFPLSEPELADQAASSWNVRCSPTSRWSGDRSFALRVVRQRKNRRPETVEALLTMYDANVVDTRGG